MKKIFVTLIFLASFISLKAQTPATVHATWNANPSTDNVIQYQVTLDLAAPITVLASTCNTTCGPIAITVPTFGLHTISVVAQNLKLNSDPTTLQSGPAMTVSFTLAAAPVVVASLKITN